MKSSTTESYSDMTEYPTERHPLEPFLPEGGKILMLGSFPPAQKRWSMDFFYPNWINDMWRIIGTVFFYDKEHFIIKGEKKFDKKKIVEFCTERGIGLYDTATEVRRLKDNASDKFLEEHPNETNTILEIHENATEFINGNPDEAASMIPSDIVSDVEVEKVAISQ